MCEKYFPFPQQCAAVRSSALRMAVGFFSWCSSGCLSADLSRLRIKCLSGSCCVRMCSTNSCYCTCSCKQNVIFGGSELVLTQW